MPVYFIGLIAGCDHPLLGNGLSKGYQIKESSTHGRDYDHSDVVFDVFRRENSGWIPDDNDINPWWQVLKPLLNNVSTLKTLFNIVEER